MATKKAGGSTQNNRDSVSKRLGIKIGDGDKARSGNILVRQRGTDIKAGPGVMMGSDNTLFAVIDGIVKYTQKKVTKYTGQLKSQKFVKVLPVTK